MVIAIRDYGVDVRKYVITKYLLQSILKTIR